MKDEYEVLLDNDEVSEDESEGDLDNIGFEDAADMDLELDPAAYDDKMMEELFNDELEED